MNENKKELVNNLEADQRLVIILILIVTLLVGSLILNFKYFKMEKDRTKEQKESIKIAEDYIKEYNEQFENQFGKEVSGDKVKKLLNDIIYNNKNSSLNMIGIDPCFTQKDGKMLTGQNNNDPSYINNEIKSKIINNKQYIVKATSVSIAYSELGFIQRITIADKSELNEEQVKKYNNDYENYLDKDITGLEVKELIKMIKQYDEEQYENNTQKYIRILFDIRDDYTTNNQRLYLLTGIGAVHFSQGDYLEEYINVIVESKQYYANVSKYNVDETISEIVITDDISKDYYINTYK